MGDHTSMSLMLFVWRIPLVFHIQYNLILKLNNTYELHELYNKIYSWMNIIYT
jgi:hypothetical protein